MSAQGRDGWYKAHRSYQNLRQEKRHAVAKESIKSTRLLKLESSSEIVFPSSCIYYTLLNEEIQDGVDDAHHDAGDGDTPEIHANAREQVDGEPNHSDVKNKGGEAKGQDGKRESKNFDEWFYDGVNEREDKAGGGIEHPAVSLHDGDLWTDSAKIGEAEKHTNTTGKPTQSEGKKLQLNHKFIVAFFYCAVKYGKL